MGEMRNVYKILVRKLEVDHSQDLGVGGRVILEWILGEYCGKVWTGCVWLRIWTSGRLL
jgi:hypothetical protein